MNNLKLAQLLADRERLLWGFVLAVIPIVIYITLIQFQMRSLTLVQSKYQQELEFIHDRDNKARDLAQARDINEKLRRELSQLEARFLSEEGLTDFLNKLSVLAKEKECTVDTMDIAEGARSPTTVISEKRIQINIVGTYVRLNEFIQALEIHEKFIQLENVRMSSGDSDMGVSLSLDLVLYQINTMTESAVEVPA